MNTFDIYILDESMPKELIFLATRLSFNIFTDDICPGKESNYFKWKNGQLKWISRDNLEIGPLHFSHQLEAHKSRNYSLKNEPFARAIGLRNRLVDGYVLDSTMGLGKDAILLKSYGFKTLGIERSPFCFFMLCTSLLEAGQGFLDYPIINCDFDIFSQLGTVNLSPGIDEKRIVYSGNEVKTVSLANLVKEFGRPNVVYFDPMYTQKNNKALPTKEMQIFREVLLQNSEEEINKLIEVGLTVAKDRVVLKRSNKANVLKHKNYGMSFKGKSTRYDVYLSR